MQISAPRRNSLVAASVVIAVFCTTATVAQAPTPGERWRTTQSMEMQGMSMPAQTREICVSVSRREESLAQVPSECEMYDIQRSARSFSAKTRCSGDHPSTGSFEQTFIGPDHIRGRMIMHTKDGDMTMNMENQKLPGACDASADERKAKQMMGKMQAQSAAELAKQCKGVTDEVQKSPETVEYALSRFFPDGVPKESLTYVQCKDPAQLKIVCAAVSSFKGFAHLSYSDRQAQRSLAKETKGKKAAVNSDPAALRTNHASLAMEKCGLGSGVAAVNALRTRLLTEAEAKPEWGFYFAEATVAQKDAIGKKECSGRAFTDAKNPKYLDFCGRWGLKFAKRGNEDGDSDAAESYVGGGAPSDNAGATAETQANSDDSKKTASDKAKEAAKKAGKALRGIFGGGN